MKTHLQFIIMTLEWISFIAEMMTTCYIRPTDGSSTKEEREKVRWKL